MRFVRTSEFGELSEIRDHPHTGIDYAMPEGTQLEALFNGVVIKVADYGNVNAGKTVVIQMDSGEQAIYGHLSEFAVKVGERVQNGDVIGWSGNTGHSTGPHLHFAIKSEEGYIDPSKYETGIQSMGGNRSFWEVLTDNKADFAPKWFEDSVNKMLENGKAGQLDNPEQSHIIVDMIGGLIKDGFVYIADSIYTVLPEIGGVITLAAGLFVMISGNPMKYIRYYIVSMTGVILWVTSG
jgi:murein DD-endopeptidase MepM/ murein hydrolase activator NlpD